MAHKKAGGSTSNNRDSNAQRLGVKLYGGEFAKPGMIIVRQRGSRYFPGLNVRKGKDDTLFAVAQGVILFKQKMRRAFTGALKKRVEVNVVGK